MAREQWYHGEFSALGPGEAPPPVPFLIQEPRETTLRRIQREKERTRLNTNEYERVMAQDAENAFHLSGAVFGGSGEVYNPRVCHCGEAHDRRCLGCGKKLCRVCQPQTAGNACVHCGSPVWADDEEMPPPIVNPNCLNY